MYEVVLGVSGDYQIQCCIGYENFVGSMFGVKGVLCCNEYDNVNNVVEYVQFYWYFVLQWVLLLGLCYDSVCFVEYDFYIIVDNFDDSGYVSYSVIMLVVGLQY